MLKFYGIKNCNSVKKAQDFLSNKELKFDFFDIKKLDEKTLDDWLSKRDILEFINTAGTTSKKLGLNKDKIINLDKNDLKQIVLNNPSCIKRPIIDKNGQIYIGKEYESFL
ncbi:arsenate reductase family protein [Campylobacter estrildidarum]|uniref:ArsC family transcriptional regulator n=1 Tax=Campylobacter estrildidarum TaxID=2510189 RepID=A0A4V6DW59_9BACT|nr:arsenate reductase family protein [Campylobacter estrildidarum]TKX29972.1 ArsC family transcriptional regulator [Campylobacter estrildidarum]